MLHALDLAVIAGWLVLTLGAGVWFSRRASGSVEDFFVSGRSLPWWIVGTSMVATTFAADTPLAVSGWVASHGIAENWVWWTFGASGIASVFLFAHLWRRSGVVTDAELVELRYGPGPGRLLRRIKAVWFGVFINVLVIAWVMSAMTKILKVVLGLEGQVIAGLPADTAIMLGLFVLTVIYTSASGLWGVVATDLVQFVVAMGSSVLLAVLAWDAAGGLEGIRAGMEAHAFGWEQTTALVPLGDRDPDGATARFFVLLGVTWWAASNIDGGGYLAQRLFAAKDDRHAVWAYLWFTVAHVCLRPWPWIVVGLAAMALIGPVEDPETYYPLMMRQLLGPGLFGLMLASFLAAFMSTIDTQLNWGASLLVNDLWLPLRKGLARSPVTASRVAVVGLAVLGGITSLGIGNVGLAWKLAFSVNAGIGTVYIARWYWWRVNAWSELTAMAVASACTGIFTLLAAHHPAAGGGWTWLESLPQGWLGYPFNAFAIVCISVPTWLLVTLATRPVDQASLAAFYARVRPGGPGWRAVVGDAALAEGPGRHTLLGILAGVAAVYGVLLGVGEALLGRPSLAVAGLVVAAVGGAVAAWEIVRHTREVGDEGGGSAGGRGRSGDDPPDQGGADRGPEPRGART